MLRWVKACSYYKHEHRKKWRPENSGEIISSAADHGNLFQRLPGDRTAFMRHRPKTLADTATLALILVITPLLWSLPTAMMVSELATAIPEEGGFYIWVRRGMGRFWGFQETWLTMTGSVFEMALYPNLCIDYIGQFAPGVVVEHRGLILGSAMIAICTAWNILGVRSVGEGSVWLNVALLAPFVALTVFALGSGRFGAAGGAPVPLRHADLLGGVLVAMWNYMGWDNLSTIAGEVEAPQRTYSRAMFWAVALVIAGYLIPRGGGGAYGGRSEPVDDGRVGRHWADCGRNHSGHRDCAGGRDWSDRVVRGADAFLHAVAAGDGGRRIPATHFRAAQCAHGGALVCDPRLRGLVGCSSFPLGFEKRPSCWM